MGPSFSSDFAKIVNIGPAVSTERLANTQVHEKVSRYITSICWEVPIGAIILI